MARIIIERECPNCQGRGEVFTEFLVTCSGCGGVGKIGVGVVVDLDGLPSRSIEAAAKRFAYEAMMWNEDSRAQSKQSAAFKAESVVRAFLADLEQGSK